MIKKDYGYTNMKNIINGLKKKPIQPKMPSLQEQEQLKNMLSTNIPRTYIMPKDKSFTNKGLTRQFFTEFHNGLVSKTKKFFGCISKKLKP